MTALFWLLAGLLLWTFFGYSFMLAALSRFKKRLVAMPFSNSQPKISIIIAAYNEERTIGQRLENCRTLDYPREKLEIIVASDGSVDKTVEIVRSFEDERIMVLDYKKNRGRAAVHNDAVKEASGEIIVFTDAGTRFERNFLKEAVKNFKDLKVGCVVGRLLYLSHNSAISQSEGLYWKYELKIRELESQLGILAIGSGACLAIKKELFRLLGAIDDVDFTSPLDVILQGYRVIYEPGAIAYDEPPASVRAEFNARVRMTSKNFIGTLRRWGFKNWFKHPFISWGLFSRRFLRWLTPYFMVMVFISNIFLLDQGWFYRAAFGGQIAFYLAGLVGWFGEVIGKRIPIASTIFSFCVANLGMMIGVAKGILGKAPASYKMPD